MDQKSRKVVVVEQLQNQRAVMALFATRNKMQVKGEVMGKFQLMPMF